MTKQIHTKFTSSKDATDAQEYLRRNGFEDVSINETEIIIQTTDDTWISAYEMANSLGGTFELGSELLSELDNQYGLDQALTNQEIEVDMVDHEAYVDINLGYGDYEIIEPYILHRFEKLSDEPEEEENEGERH